MNMLNCILTEQAVLLVFFICEVYNLLVNSIIARSRQ
jgi:hypothetical protein